MIKMFHVDPAADTNGTSGFGYFCASYAQLEAALGPPLPCRGGDGKVSTRWALVAPNGAVLTVYDWKATNLYHSDLPAVADFRADPSPRLWNVGARSPARLTDFCKWLAEQIGTEPRETYIEPLRGARWPALPGEFALG